MTVHNNAHTHTHITTTEHFMLVLLVVMLAMAVVRPKSDHGEAHEACVRGTGGRCGGGGGG